jgi:hypothetical protein
MPRDGSVSKEIFEQVEALTKQGNLKTQAFAQIAADTGRNPGTVAANYYRAARSNVTTSSRRRRKATPRASAPLRRNARSVTAANGSDIDRLADDAVRSVKALADAVKRQDADVAQLRGRLESLRKAIG